MFVVCVCVFPNFFSNKSRSFLLHTICTARICQRNLRGRPSLYPTHRPMQWRLLKSWWQSRNRRRMGAHEPAVPPTWWMVRCLVFGIKSHARWRVDDSNCWTSPSRTSHRSFTTSQDVFCNSRCATWIWKHGSFATAISSAPIGGWRRIAESSESALQQRWARHPNTICFVNRFGSPDSWIVTRINGFSQTASKNAVSWAMGNWKILANTFEYVHLVHGFC